MFKIQRLFALLILLIYLSPNIFFAGRARYLVHDNLNSNHVWLKNLAESGLLCGPSQSKILRTHDGLERGCYPSELNVIPWLYELFPDEVAYNINICIIHLIAFIGMLLLLRRHVLSDDNYGIALFCSLLFALLPFWPSAGLSIAGQPLVLFAMLNVLRGDHRFFNFLVVLLFPFYSSFFFSNAFFIVALGILWIVDAMCNKRLSIPFISMLILFGVVSIACEYRLLFLKLHDNFVFNRDIVGVGSLNFMGVLSVALLHFLKGHYHYHGYQFPFIPLLVCLALFCRPKSREKSLLVVFTVCCALLSLLFSVFQWSSLLHLLGPLMPSFPMRFHALAPLTWYCLLALSCNVIIQAQPRLKNAIFVLLSALVLWSFAPLGRSDLSGSEFPENTFYGTFVVPSSSEYTTTARYYQVSLFKQISQKIPKAGFVGCLGIESIVAQYNGYNTVGGYYPLYSLRFMHSFESVVHSELTKDKRRFNIKRPELFSYELQHHILPIHNLAWNFDTLRSMHCSYIFSSAPIRVKELTDEQVFSSDDAKLYVYRLTK